MKILFSFLFFSLFCGHLVSAQFTVTVTQGNLCYGSGSGSVSISPSTGYKYNWSNGESSASIGMLTAGTYSCTVSNMQGVALDTISAVITSPEIGRDSFIVVKTSCPGAHDGALTVITTGGTPPYTFYLAQGDSFTTVPNDSDFTVNSTGIFSNLDTGMVFIITQDTNHCKYEFDEYISYNSICTGIKDIPQLNSFTLQPNPASDFTSIVYQLNEATSLKISLLDITGKKLIEILNEEATKGQHTIPIMLNQLPSGEYILNVVSDKGSFNTPLIKQ